MQRRKLLKSVGLFGLLAVLAGVCPGCKNKNESTAATTEKQEMKKPETKNRQKMHFKDPANPTKYELKHTPDIIVGDTDAKGFTKVEITVGSKGIIHPATKDHWIDFIELYSDGKLVGRTVIEPGMARGFNAFRIKMDGVKKLKAVIGCNLHGIWENTLSL